MVEGRKFRVDPFCNKQDICVIKEMKDIESKIMDLNWNQIAGDMHQKGYALIPNLLTDRQSEELKTGYNDPDAYRKTVVMERYRFGLGEYKYFNYPLPAIIQSLRETIYPKLVPIANEWMNVLKIETRFPETLSELLALSHRKKQSKPTPLILKYGPGGHNTLHQDLYGEVWFPLQTVLFLSDPDLDYTGGEFVLIQQTPRAQSRAIVLKPKKGELLIFTTNFRPVKSSRGYYRANMKHGVSEVHTGERYTLGVIFHDATN
jgi:uncharacterized protein